MDDGHERFAFEPLFNLRTARVVGFEVRPRHSRDHIAARAAGSVWGTRQVVELDAAVALLEALRELRSWGFRIALDDVAAGFGLDVLAAARPDLVKLDAHLVAGLPAGGLERTVAGAVVDVARAVGSRVVAVGVSRREELAALVELGVMLAQGPLLSAPRRRPSMSGVALPVDLTLAGVVPTGEPAPADPRIPAPTGPSTVRELAQAAVTLPDTATADDARRAFGDHPHAGGVVLMGPHQVPTCYLDRNRFMLAISGPYGRALYAARPAATLGDRPRLLDELTPVADALRWSLGGDPTRSYDDVVLVSGGGACTGVVRVADLLRTATATAA